MSLDTCALFPLDSPTAGILGWFWVLRARASWDSPHQVSSRPIPIDLSWPIGLATCSALQLSLCAVRSWTLHRAFRSDLCDHVDDFLNPISARPSALQPLIGSVSRYSPLLALAAPRWAYPGFGSEWSHSNSRIAVSDRSARRRCLGISCLGSQLRIGGYFSGLEWDLSHSTPSWIDFLSQLVTYWI